MTGRRTDGQTDIRDDRIYRANIASSGKKRLQLLVQRQATAKCKSVQVTVPAVHVVIRAHSLTTDTDVRGFHQVACVKHIL